MSFRPLSRIAGPSVARPRFPVVDGREPSLLEQLPVVDLGEDDPVVSALHPLRDLAAMGVFLLTHQM